MFVFEELEEPRFTVGKVARRLRMHKATVFRWAQRGVRGQRLGTVLIGGTRYVRASDLTAFLDALNGTSIPAKWGERRRAEVADKQLDALGVKRLKPDTGRSQEA